MSTHLYHICGFATSFLLSTPIWAQSIEPVFQEIPVEAIGTLPATGIRTAWGDYDADGDQDLLASYKESAQMITKLLQNDGAGAFTQVAIPFNSPNAGPSAWGDYDNDGDLDLVVGGAIDNGIEVPTRLYHNEEGQFVEEAQAFEKLNARSIGWADADQDGDLDLMLAHDANSGLSDRIYYYRNESPGVFRLIQEILIDMWAPESQTVQWVDFDSDGDQDLSFSHLISENTGGFFSSMRRVSPVSGTTPIWGDFDGDGDMDAVAGRQVLHNDAGTLGTVQTLSIYASGQAADYDNDGDLDLVIPTSTEIFILKNDGSGQFTSLEPGLHPARRGSTTWVDVNNDGRLDIASDVLDKGFSIYQQVGGVAAVIPAPPTQLRSILNKEYVTISWKRPEGARGTTFNVRVTGPGGKLVLSGQVRADGRRLLPQPGNAGNLDSLVLVDLPVGTYTWSVQSIGGSYESSAFSPEASFEVPMSYRRTLIESTPPFPQNVGEGSYGYSFFSTQDVDADGNVDVLVGNTFGQSLMLFNNQSGTFQNAWYRSNYMPFKAVWADLDQDGDDDLISCVRVNNVTSVHIWANEEGTFSLKTERSGNEYATCEALDHDMDGDIDVFFHSNNRGTVSSTTFLRNDGNLNFSAVTPSFQPGGIFAVDVIDYDIDGSKDLFFTKSGSPTLYRNTRGSFDPVNTNFMEWAARGAWGDFDQDGDPDLVTGYLDTRIYRNDRDEGFTEFLTPFPYIYPNALRWSDYDVDGDLDLIVQGNAGMYIARNDRQRGFRRVDLNLPFDYYSIYAVADLDGQGGPDFIVSGRLPGMTERLDTRIFYNTGEQQNTPPQPPSLMEPELYQGLVRLRWNRGSDAETSPPGLTYNLRVGTRPGAADVMSAGVSGKKLAGPGNMGQALQQEINLPAGKYYWSVQSVDASYAASAFSAEGSFDTSTLPVEAEDQEVNLPKAFAVRGNYPNPAARVTQFVLDLPEPAEVGFRLYDLLGREVMRLEERAMAAGSQLRVPVNVAGLQPGVYLYEVRAQAGTTTHKSTGRLVVVR